MIASRRALVCVGAAALVARLAAAEFTPVIASSAPVVPAAEVRAISPTAAEKLAAAAPKYFPPPIGPKAVEPGADLREVDKPRNGIIRLPSYLVQEEKLPALKPRDMLTPQGGLDLAYRRHPGLRFGNFWIFRNDGIALFMLEEEMRLERQRESYDLVSLLPTTEAKKTKAMVDQAFSRTDFGPSH
jgi:hypothetical protein